MLERHGKEAAPDRRNRAGRRATARKRSASAVFEFQEHWGAAAQMRRHSRQDRSMRAYRFVNIVP